jgi:hypothetical protein
VSRKQSNDTLTVIGGGALVVCALWAIITGACWQFVPVIAAIALVSAAAKVWSK